jgi:hypothetical protein
MNDADWLVVSVRASAIELCIITFVMAAVALRRHLPLLSASSVFVIGVSKVIMISAISDIGLLLHLIDTHHDYRFGAWGAPFIMVYRGLAIWAYMRLAVVDKLTAGEK